jgi:ATP-binding cassette subfamily B protein
MKGTDPDSVRAADALGNNIEALENSQPEAPSQAPDAGAPTDLTSLGAFLRRIGRILTSTPARTVLIALALAIDTSFTIAVPVSFRYLVDHAIALRDGTALLRVLIGLAIGVLLAAIAGIGRDYLWARFSIEMLNGIRTEMFEHLLRLSMDFFSRTGIAEIAARFSTDLASVEGALSAAPGWALVPTLDACVSLSMLFVLDWRLALVASLVVPVSLLGPRLAISRAAAASYRRKIDESGLVGVVQENIAAHTVVRAFGLERIALAHFQQRLATLETSSIRTAWYGSLLERSSGIGTLMLQVIVMGAGATMAYHGRLSIGSLAAFLTLFLTLSWSIGYVSQYFPYLLQAAAGTRRINELLNEPARVADLPGASEVPQFTGRIRFECVTFGYNPGRRNLDNLSFEFPSGASVAFVGPSGCGKSTVLSLLMRFYDPLSGRISVDGVDISRVTQASLRARMGVVFQDTILFNTSIRENIRLGKLGATDAEVESAARAAEMHELIVKLPQGYDTAVGERGGRLSGGQRQRIAIARAILRDPKILVLDEATSALDAETEAAINRTVKRLSQGRTVISVTHRLASVTEFQHVFVLESGRLAEAGSHNELLAQGGLYARLWKKQSSVSVEGGDQRATITPSSLRAIPIFRNLNDGQQAMLAATLSTERWPAGREVFRQGDRGDKLYVIARGTVTVNLRANAEKDESDEEKLMAVLEDGDYFGEIALIEDAPRTATIRTRTDCVFLTLPCDTFLNLLDSSPDLRSKFEIVSRQRRRLSQAAVSRK